MAPTPFSRLGGALRSPAPDCIIPHGTGAARPPLEPPPAATAADRPPRAPLAVPTRGLNGPGAPVSNRAPAAPDWLQPRLKMEGVARRGCWALAPRLSPPELAQQLPTPRLAAPRCACVVAGRYWAGARCCARCCCCCCCCCVNEPRRPKVSSAEGRARPQRLGCCEGRMAAVHDMYSPDLPASSPCRPPAPTLSCRSSRSRRGAVRSLSLGCGMPIRGIRNGHQTGASESGKRDTQPRKCVLLPQRVATADRDHSGALFFREPGGRLLGFLTYTLLRARRTCCAPASEVLRGPRQRVPVAG